MDLASLHLRLWRLHLAVDLELLELEEAEPRLMPHLEPMAAIELDDDDDGDAGARLGFRLR
jgi:hypothetical protein